MFSGRTFIISIPWFVFKISLVSFLCSNAIKFTHEGKVGIKLYVVSEPHFGKEGSHQKRSIEQSSSNNVKEEKHTLTAQTNSDQNGFHSPKHGEGPCQNHLLNNEPRTPVKKEKSMDEDTEEQREVPEKTVWIRCDVYDTGIGIPGMYLSLSLIIMNTC